MASSISNEPEAEVAIQISWMPSQSAARNPREDWTGVTSTAQRRRLQNRLNQRASRKRRQAKDAAAAEDSISQGHVDYQHPIQDNNSVGGDQEHSNLDARRRNGSRTLKNLVDACAVSQHTLRGQFAQLAAQSYARGQPNLSHLPLLVHYNVYSGLARNAELLGVSVEWLLYDAISPFYKHLERPSTNSSPSPVLEPLLSNIPHSASTTSPRSDSNCPPSLFPTPQQFKTEHHPWIDLFPLPRLRDNILRAIEMDDGEPCDEDDLCRDLIHFGDLTDRATLIVWGQPWDARSWEVTIGFLRKWGYLLVGCADILEATNYWRQKRGEKKFSARDVFEAIARSSAK